MRKSKTYLAVSVTEYDDGKANIYITALDTATGRIKTEWLSTVDQLVGMPLSQDELLVLGALEHLSRRLYGEAAGIV